MNRPALRHVVASFGTPRRWAWAGVLAAAAACLWLAVQLVWSLLTPVAAPVATSATATPRAVAAPVTDVARWHLFGNGQANRIAIDIANAGNRTALKLVLHGTVADADPRAGYALIADEHRVERSYHVGDRIQDGVTLAAVYADRVVLNNHGRNETLDLPRDDLRAASAQPVARVHPDLGMTNVTSPAAPTTGDGGKTPVFIAPNIAAAGAGWNAAQAAVRDNPAQALQQFDIQPVMDGTKLRGVRLGGGASNPIAAAAGLGADDVVTAVNGVPLDSLSRGQELMTKLHGATHVTLTVENGGQTRTINVDVPPQP